jgi:putative GTP pyrophosphokinase
MADIDALIESYESHQHEYGRFLDNVRSFFEHEPSLNQSPFPIIHSLKWRLKDSEHLRDKLQRKLDKGEDINGNNLFEKITDFAGIRVLHLYQNQFIHIHNAIKKFVDEGEWKYVEPPIANTWDPESEKYFQELGLKCNRRDTYYTSIHYVVKPNNERSHICCEIQVRTLFEEIWGEIDHSINYPHPTESVACKEQLRVLAKFISTGTRLADSIFKSLEEYNHSKGL